MDWKDSRFDGQGRTKSTNMASGNQATAIPNVEFEYDDSRVPSGYKIGRPGLVTEKRTQEGAGRMGKDGFQRSASRENAVLLN